MDRCMGAGRLQFVPVPVGYGLLMIGNSHETYAQRNTKVTLRYELYTVLTKWSKYEFVEVC